MLKEPSGQGALSNYTPISCGHYYELDRDLVENSVKHTQLCSVIPLSSNRMSEEPRFPNEICAVSTRLE